MEILCISMPDRQNTNISVGLRRRTIWCLTSQLTGWIMRSFQMYDLSTFAQFLWLRYVDQFTFFIEQLTGENAVRILKILNTITVHWRQRSYIGQDIAPGWKLLPASHTCPLAAVRLSYWHQCYTQHKRPCFIRLRGVCMPQYILTPHIIGHPHMFGQPPVCLDTPHMFGWPSLYVWIPHMFGHTCMFGCPHMFGYPLVCVDTPPYVWTTSVCLDALHMFGYLLVCMDVPICLHNHLCVWMPPCIFGCPCKFGCPHMFKCPPNVWRHPDIQGGCPDILGTSKHTGGIQTYRGHPNIQGGVQSYGGCQMCGRHTDTP